MTRTRKTLDQILSGVDILGVWGDPNQPVSGIQYDSRKVSPGDVFVAIDGLKQDGHQFLPDAMRRGAAAAVVSQDSPRGNLKCLVKTSGTRTALAQLAANFFDHPSQRFELVGITGTKGKTTLTYLLEQVLLEAGFVPGILGTIQVRFPGFQQDAAYTTPEATDLQARFEQMHGAGVTHVAMEVSSHALEQERARYCHFRVAVFTNLSRDHLDFHGDMESYARAKTLLFSRELRESEKQNKVAVANCDDPRCPAILRDWKGPQVTFGCSPQAMVRPLEPASHTLGGFHTRVATPAGIVDLACRLPGRHNLYNALAALAVGCSLGIEPDTAAAGIAACATVPGRLERVPGEGPKVFVDYSHTDAALANVLEALRPLTAGRLIVVFGCGGDRDRGKRPLMGAEVAKGADLALITSDNPRSEDPLGIIEEILPGMDEKGWKRIEARDLDQASRGSYAVLVDRREAIAYAVGIASPQDVVLIAGKGHETYQIVGDTRHHFDDREEAARVLSERARKERG